MAKNARNRQKPSLSQRATEDSDPEDTKQAEEEARKAEELLKFIANDQETPDSPETEDNDQDKKPAADEKEQSSQPQKETQASMENEDKPTETNESEEVPGGNSLGRSDSSAGVAHLDVQNEDENHNEIARSPKMPSRKINKKPPAQPAFSPPKLQPKQGEEKATRCVLVIATHDCIIGHFQTKGTPKLPGCFNALL